MSFSSVQSIESVFFLSDDTYFQAVTNASYCNMKCPGDSLACGGLYYYNVYPAVSSTPKDVNFQLTVVSSIKIS
jgi:hypothetical protein